MVELGLDQFRSFWLKFPQTHFAGSSACRAIGQVDQLLQQWARVSITWLRGSGIGWVGLGCQLNRFREWVFSWVRGWCDSSDRWKNITKVRWETHLNNHQERYIYKGGLDGAMEWKGKPFSSKTMCLEMIIFPG